MIEPEVLYEDKNFLAVVKPAGLLTHATRTSHEPTLVEWLLTRHPEIRNVGDAPGVRPGIVHRLDKGTSGVMLVAKTQEYFAYLKSLFQRHQIKKTYRALVVGRLEPKTGVVEKPIGIARGTVKRSVHSEKLAKAALTEYKVQKYFAQESGKGFSLVEVWPATGRTHQIRVHLASVGHPVVGDTMYGPGRQPPWAQRLMLHASSVEFSTEDGRRFKVEAEVPKDFQHVINHLNF